MGTDTRETFFTLGTENRIDNFDDFDEWRSAVANAEDVDAAEAGRYAERVDAVANRENIDDIESILAPSTDSVAGESGEAASAVQYADNGADVEIEPGNRDYYDMAVTEDGQTAYVEVKTRASGDVNERYISDRISDMNNKYDSALDDSGLDVEENTRVLEIRTRAETDELSSIQEEAESAVAIRSREGDVEIDEIRLVAENGDTVTIEL